MNSSVQGELKKLPYRVLVYISMDAVCIPVQLSSPLNPSAHMQSGTPVKF